MNGPDARVDVRRNCELSVIVVTYGARDVTLHCLESVTRAARNRECEVIIVDNGSPDGMAVEIASRFPQFRVHARVRNSGFALAGNFAARHANGAYLLFLNPDTVVQEDAFDRILKFAGRRPAAGIWGGRTLFADGTANPSSCRRRVTLWRLFCSAFALDTRFRDFAPLGGAGYAIRAMGRERAVDVVCGCFLLVDKMLWDRLGGFSPAFFMYGEDDDLSLRARKLGYRPGFTPDAAIVHLGSGTEMNKERKVRQILAARALYVRIHFSPVARVLAIALLSVRPLLGRRFAKPELRDLWRKVWACRARWAAGCFESQ